MKDPVGYQIDDLRVDTRMRRVTRNGVPLEVAGLTYDLLMALVAAAPRLLSSEELLLDVWPGVVVGPETLTQRIKLLRQALDDNAEAPRYVGATRGHGYRLLPAVTLLAASDLADHPPVGLPAPERARSANRYAAISAIALLVAAIALALLWLVWQRDGHRPSAASGESKQASVAVMPFANLTGQAGLDYLGDGMAEELINVLAEVPGLKVPARTSTFAYKGHSIDVRRIATDLGVKTVLEGSVRSAGERLRISARLVDATSGFQMWSHDYDRESTDIFKLQDDIAAEIVGALRTRLNVDLPRTAPHPVPTQDLAAYQLYLRARDAANGTAESFLRGIALDDQALARDPNFARALADRADHRMALVAIGHPLPQGLDDAEHDAQQALALDPKQPGPYAILGAVNSLRHNWIGAEVNFQAAIAADPSDGYIRCQHAAFVFASAGRLEEARAEALHGMALAPAHGFCAVVMVLVRSAQGDDQDTLKYVDLALKSGAAPQQFATFLAQVAAHQGRYAAAGTNLADALSPDMRSIAGGETVQLAYLALGDAARRPEARRALVEFTHKLSGASLNELIVPQFMQLLVLLDAPDEAYVLIRRAKSATLNRGWELALWGPDMRSFRQDARFSTLARELNLLDFWRRYGPPDGCQLENEALGCH